MANNVMHSVKPRSEKTTKLVMQFLTSYVILAAGIVFLFNVVLMLNLVPSGSMENTIMAGDVMLATRYDKKDVERYDIMVFTPPDAPDDYYVKRVIGLPGETIVVHEGVVYANGVTLDDSFTPEEMSTSGDGTYVVPDGHYFMLGDNRNHSLDARFWDEKYVPVENMVAKARFTFFPFQNASSLSYQADTYTVAAEAAIAENGNEAEHSHLWVPVTTHHDETGHYEVIYETRNLMRCDCGEIFYDEDALQAHLHNADDDCDQPHCVKTPCQVETGKQWVVDHAAWDELVGYKCNGCGDTKNLTA